MGLSRSRALASSQFRSNSAWWSWYHSRTSASARRGNSPLTTPSLIVTVAVRRVEVGRLVITVEYRDHDSEEPTDFRHGTLYRLGPMRALGFSIVASRDRHAP